MRRPFYNQRNKWLKTEARDCAVKGAVRKRAEFLRCIAAPDKCGRKDYIQMWKEKLAEIAQEKSFYEETVNAGASEDEIRLLCGEMEKELHQELPDGYAGFLDTVNGLEFNGFILYGIDPFLLSSEPQQQISGLIDNNKIWYENEWQRKFVFLGESSISWYVFDTEKRCYCELDRPSGDVVSVFRDAEDMLEHVLSDALM